MNSKHITVELKGALAAGALRDGEFTALFTHDDGRELGVFTRLKDDYDYETSEHISHASLRLQERIDGEARDGADFHKAYSRRGAPSRAVALSQAVEEMSNTIYHALTLANDLASFDDGPPRSMIHERR